MQSFKSLRVVMLHKEFLEKDFYEKINFWHINSIISALLKKGIIVIEGRRKYAKRIGDKPRRI